MGHLPFDRQDLGSRRRGLTASEMTSVAMLTKM
jgi:hypothetical protein